MGYGLDIEAISGILGSISIACWVVVFSPQIIENYSKKSADGLSIEFIVIWLGKCYWWSMFWFLKANAFVTAGDFFNMAGGVLQGIMPTMVCTPDLLYESLPLTMTRSSLPSTIPLQISSCFSNASTTGDSPFVTRNPKARQTTSRTATLQSARLSSPMVALAKSSKEPFQHQAPTAPPIALAPSPLTATTSPT